MIACDNERFLEGSKLSLCDSNAADSRFHVVSQMSRYEGFVTLHGWAPKLTLYMLVRHQQD